MPKKKHVLITCYDQRIDPIVSDIIDEIRSQGGLLAGKDIIRIPGGVHLLAGKSDCRKTFYELLTSYRDIAKTDVFHFFPHTNCQYCGIHFQEKLGSGNRSDLRFHLRSAEKLLAGVIQHFSNLSDAEPELDARIILTIDRSIVSIDEAYGLLPHVPDHEHGAPCRVHHHVAPVSELRV